MENIYANADFYKKSGDSFVSLNKTGPQSSEKRFHGAVVLCLGLLSLLLLVGLIILGASYHSSVHGLAAELSSVQVNLTRCLRDDNNLTEERDELNVKLSEVTEELNRLKNFTQQKKTCPVGWTMFGPSCYLLSGKSDVWEKGREDCRGRGAHLVVIDSHEEQTFVSKLTSTFWIGLNDTEKEGTWKWIDNSPLTLTYWGKNEPNNYNNDEDCGHMTSAHFWNDKLCSSRYMWVCETKAQHCSMTGA